jgi:cellulose synthase/poly-beta-1,6-N-acetylglucosamine synthase-like glycosyltransferase
MEILDRILIFIQDYVLYVRSQFFERTLLMWILFFFPLVVFFELPRYATPLIVMPILRLLRLLRSDEREKRHFLATRPPVSVVIAARNEEKVIASTIESLLAIDYENLEIVLVDDASTDGTYRIAKQYADRGLIELYRNTAETGRAGRPTASNFGFRMSTGEFIISVDADTTFDRDMLHHVIGPFYDPRVGVVAGNIKARNVGESVWADLQAAEYLMSIGLWKRWTDVLGTTLAASGAFGAFRREVLRDMGAWDPELTEDADISIKARKLNWKLVFAHDAIAMTTVPPGLRDLVRQRIRWDRGFLRTFFHKHADALKFWRFNFATAWELVQEYLMVVVFNLLFPIYLVLMVIFAFKLLTFVLIVCYLFYSVLTLLTLSVAISFSERSKEEWPLLQYAFLFPLYKALFRWVRTYALALEILRVKYRDPYLPESAYDNVETW